MKGLKKTETNKVYNRVSITLIALFSFVMVTVLIAKTYGEFALAL